MIFLLICTTVALAGPSASGSLRATTIEGKVVRGDWSGVDAGGGILLGKDAGGPLRADELMLVQWDREPLTTRPEGERFPVLVMLADGSRLWSRIIGNRQHSLALETDLLPRLEVPMSDLVALRFATVEDSAAEVALAGALKERQASEDALIIIRENRPTTLRGVVVSLTEQGGLFRWRGREVPIQPEATYALVFATGVQQARPATTFCVLRDGSAWAGRLAGGSIEAVRLTVAGDVTISIPVASIVHMRFESSRVLFLDGLQPTAYAFESLGASRWPYRLNRSVANRPIRMGDLTFDRGIGVHSRSTLEYEVPPGYQRLAATIGIDDGARPLGNVIFRVLADDKQVFDSGPVAGHDEPRAILVPIAGAKKVQLVVDFGEDLDIGDQANWANVRFIK